MANNLSNYAENLLINALLRNTAFTPPTNVYTALYTADPGEADGGTEVSGGAYARQVTTFGAPTDGAVANSAVVTFPVATANWGTVSHFAFRDAANGGNALFYGPVGTPKAYTTGDQATFPAGSLTAALS